MSFPPNEFPERASGCCTEGGSMVPLPSGRLDASQHYARETPTSSFMFVLYRDTHTRTLTHTTSRFCAAQEKKASSPSCEDKSLWWNERGDTVQFSRWVTPLFTIIQLNVLHQCPKKLFYSFFRCCRWTLCGLCPRQNHPSGSALSAVCSFFIRLSVIIHFWVTAPHVGSNGRKLIFCWVLPEQNHIYSDINFHWKAVKDKCDPIMS